MIKVTSKNGQTQIYLLKRELDEIRKELRLLYKLGGRNIYVEYNKKLSNYLPVYDDNKNKIGEIVGASAVILSDIIGKSEDNVFMGFPVSIYNIFKEYLEEIEIIDTI